MIQYDKVDEKTTDAFVEFEKYMKVNDVKLPRVLPSPFKKTLSLTALFVAGFNAGRESK